MRAKRKQRGMTLTEIVIGAALSVTAIFVSSIVFLSGMKSWATGQGRINSDVYAQQSIRRITVELREAMSVTVDANGQGLTYRLPLKSVNGSFVVPATWDGITRRIELFQGNLRIVAGERRSILARGVITTDPSRNNESFRIFVPGPGTITRDLDVMIVTNASGYRTEYKKSRIRETIFLRNIPSLSR